MRLTVRPGGQVILTAPVRFSITAIEQFLACHSRWIERSVEKMSHLKMLPSGKRAYTEHKEAARDLVRERVEHWNTTYRFKYGRIAIKDTKSLWGSCSRRGNLNFSYKLLFLPQELIDYVIVHELCHLREHNHGLQFWALVRQTQPEHLRLRKELRRYVLR